MKRSRRGRKGERVPARMPREHRPRPTPQPVSRDRVRVVIPIAAIIAVIGCLAATVAAWQTPEAAGKQGSKQRYDQSLALTYSGVVPRSTAYPDGAIRNGDSVYQKITTRIDVNVASDLAYKGRAQVNGWYDVVAQVSGSGGFHGSIPLATHQPFADAHAHFTAPLDFQAVHDMLVRFQRETGLDAAQATIDVVASVHSDAVLDRHKIPIDNSVKAEFAWTSVLVTPAAAPGSNTPGTPAHNLAQPIVASQAGLVGGGRTTSHSGMLSLWMLKVPVPAARVGGIFAMALVLGAAAIAARMHRRHLRGGELHAIESRYRRYLVTTPEIPTMRDKAVVEVASMNVLVKLAEAQAEVILHATTDHGEDFAVVTDSAIYVYGTTRRSRARSGRIAAA